MESKRIDEILKQNEYLQSQRGNWDSGYQDIASFVLPRKAWINSIRVMGEQIHLNFLYSSRAIRDLKKSAAGFQSKLTNPSSKWFGFQCLDIKKRESRIIQKYFKEVEDIQSSVMARSNFYNTNLEFYTDALAFGTANILTQEDPKQHVRYTSVPIEQYNFEEDADGRVCKVYRNFHFTANQCYSRWQEKCSPDMKKAIADGEGYKLFEILHFVEERYARNASKRDYLNMPWASCWIAKKEKHYLDEKGFEENPYSVTRFWKDANDPRGFSPSMDVIATIKLVNAMKRTFIRAAMKASDPATMMPNKGWLNAPNLNPSAVNYYDAKKTNPDAWRAIENKGNFQVSIDAMRLEDEEIDQAYYIPMFEAMANITKKMTIPEVQQRIAENMQFVGPTIGRFLDEGIGPQLLRTYAILNRKGLFPDPPKELFDEKTGEGEEIDIIYLSPLAKAQRQSEITGLQAWLQLVREIAQVRSEAADVPDVDKIVVSSGELLGVDPEFCSEKRIIDAIREKRAQTLQMQQQIEMSNQAADTAHKGAQAQKAMAEASK